MEKFSSAIIGYNIDVNELKKIIQDQNLDRLKFIDSTDKEDMLISDIISNEPKKVANSEISFSENNSFIIFHNVSGKTVNEVIKSIKIKSKSCIFATTTETNMNWTLKELLSELIQEHKRFGN
ncbi:MAG: DUF3783 domain-containing protein [Kosmotogaceae bacterium]